MGRRTVAVGLAFLLLGSGGWLGVRLLWDDGAPPRVATTRHTRQSGPAYLGAESRAESRTESRADSRSLTLTPQDGAIRGNVVDHGGIAVNHATVTVELRVPPGDRNFALVASFKETVHVDDEGKFQLVVPGGGIFRVTAEATGFAPAVKTGVRPGDQVELTLDVGATLHGVVTDKVTQRPVAETEIVLAFEGLPLRKARSDANGAFDLTDLPAGKLVLSAYHDDYVPQPTIERTAEPGQVITLAIELESGKSIRGQVLSADEQRPIEGATITVRRKKAKSDSSGRFVVRGLEPESQGIMVAAEGFQADQRSINLAGSRQEAVAEFLLQRGGTIRGRVHNERGEPLAGVELRLFETWGRDSYEEDWATRHLNVKSADDGTFKFSGVPGREWLEMAVRGKKEGYPDTYERGVRIKKADDEAFVLVTMKRGAVVSGRIVDNENRPVVGARVEIRPRNSYEWWNPGENGMESRTKISGTNADGEFRFESLTSARFDVTVQARGFSTGYKNDIDLTNGGQVAGITITLEKGNPLKGFVVDADEKPVPAANIQVWTQKGSGQAISDPEGRFVIECVPPGPYDVWAQATGFAGVNLRKQMPTGEQGLRIQLKKQAVLSGTVVDAVTKKPIEAFRAVLSTEDARRGNRPRMAADTYARDKDGKFRVQAEAGVYKLEVFATGYVRATKEQVSLEPGKDPEPVVIEMKKGGAIEGIVRRGNGQPEIWVNVYVAKDDGVSAFGGSVQTEHDGYFFVGDLDQGSYKVAFQRNECPVLVQSGVYVGSDKPAFVEVQVESTVTLTLDVVAEAPKDEEKVAGATDPGGANGPMGGVATNGAPSAGSGVKRPFYPRVRLWLEATDDTILGFNWEWTGVEELCRPMKRRDVWLPRGTHATSVVRDLPPGQYIVHATSPGFEDYVMPIRLRDSTSPVLRVQLTALPKELRPPNAFDSNPRQRVHRWTDNEGNERLAYWTEDG